MAENPSGVIVWELDNFEIKDLTSKTGKTIDDSSVVGNSICSNEGV